MVDDPVFGEFNTLNNSLHTLDERGLVLSLTAFAEDSLGSLLKAFMLRAEATTQLLEGFNAPLGTLSSRIRVAYALGLISKPQFEDLERLRKIRNHFAHNWRPLAFSDPRFTAHIKALHYSSIENVYPKTLFDKLRSSIISILVALRSNAHQIEIKGKSIKVIGGPLTPGFSGDIDQQIRSATKQLKRIEIGLRSKTAEKQEFFKVLHERLGVQLYLILSTAKNENRTKVLALWEKLDAMKK